MGGSFTSFSSLRLQRPTWIHRSGSCHILQLIQRILADRHKVRSRHFFAPFPEKYGCAWRWRYCPCQKCRSQKNPAPPYHYRWIYTSKHLHKPRHCETSPQTGRGNPFSHKIESYKSNHFGFIDSTKVFFLFLFQDFICFSLDIAS